MANELAPKMVTCADHGVKNAARRVLREVALLDDVMKVTLPHNGKEVWVEEIDGSDMVDALALLDELDLKCQALVKKARRRVQDAIVRGNLDYDIHG